LTIVDYYDIFLLVMNMKFYKIKLRSLPEIIFAHAYKTSDYRRTATVMRNFLELSYVIEGHIELISQHGRTIIPQGCSHCDLYSYPSVTIIDRQHQHCTVGIKMEYDFEVIDEREVLSLWRDSFTNKVALSDTVIAAEFITDPRFSDRIRDRINDVIRLFALGTHESLLAATSQVFSILSCITEAAVNIASGDVSYSDIAYCAKASAYISKNADRQITVKEIADELNISVGHLSRMFRFVTGDSIIQYVNKTKVERAKGLILSGLRTGEISEMLGITDEKYFCRMFKKYAGVTVSQYRKSGR